MAKGGTKYKIDRITVGELVLQVSSLVFVVLPPTCNGSIPVPWLGLRLVTDQACEPGKWLYAATSCSPLQANYHTSEISGFPTAQNCSQPNSQSPSTTFFPPSQSWARYLEVYTQKPTSIIPLTRSCRKTCVRVSTAPCSRRFQSQSRLPGVRE